MNLSKYIDHTILKPTATRAEVEQLCIEAKQYGFASVCINPCWVALAAGLLKGTDVKVCTVIGFPLGANTTAVKVFESKDALNNGAGELDLVINIGAMKSGLYEEVYHDIKLIRDLGDNFTLKVILETCLLTDAQKIKACEICTCAKADFVKTSTGFSTGGATVEDIKLMKANIAPGMQVKASGGIRDFAAAKQMVDAGATRIGASASIKIVMEK